MLLRTVRATIQKYNMFKPRDVVVVAVSGGPDSVGLLHILHSLRDIYNITLHAAHLEHGIRGKEALEDLDFVKEFCSRLGVPLVSRHDDVPAYAKQRKMSLEAAARKLRYRFLEDVLEAVGGTKIATGHNANDQAETILLNILRGTGFAGLSGIRPAVQGRIVRPLIEATRAEIEDYLKHKGLRFRIDSSNLDDRYERNKIRQMLIPMLEKEFNPRIVSTLARTASLFAMIDEYFRERVTEAAQLCCSEKDGRTIVNLEAFGELPLLVRMATIYSVLRSYEEDEQVATFDTVSAVLNLADRSKSGSRIDVGSGIVALKEYDHLVIGRDLALADSYEVRLEVPGKTEVDCADCAIEVEILDERPGKGEVFRSGESAYFDFRALKLPLVARSWREGDRFVPFGLAGSKKVHDIFIDEKVPVSERARIPIICDKEGIIWVAGVRRADRARVTDETETIIKITYCKRGKNSR